MAWPTDDLNTTNLDTGSDSPALARPMLARAITRLKSVINARGVPNGIARLDITGKVPAGQLPDSALAGTPLWRPTGAYQQMATGTTLLSLTASAAPFRRLRVEVDYKLAGRSSHPREGIEHIPAKLYDGFGIDLFVYRGRLPSAGFYSHKFTNGAGVITMGLQLTSNTSITVQLSRSTSNTALRLYGIYGYTT